MNTTISNMRRGALAMLAAGTLIAGCADGAPLGLFAESHPKVTCAAE